MAAEKIISSFSPNGEYFAVSSLDRPLKIWETVSGNLISDFKPSKNLTATCTCVQWGPGRHLKSSQQPSPPKKKRRKSQDPVTVERSVDLIALGTSSGTVLLYSLARGEIHRQLEGVHTKEVTDLCWHPDGSVLYSCSRDGLVVEWDLASFQVMDKWKASTSSEGVSSMCLCSKRQLLTADNQIKMWDLTKKPRKSKQGFIGHASEVFRLLPIIHPIGSDNDQPSCSYFLSAAVNDRTIQAWYCHPDSPEKKSIASFRVKEEPISFSLSVSDDKTITLAVLSAQGNVSIYKHILNGRLKKPLECRQVVSAATAGSKEEVAVPVPILAAQPLKTPDSRLVVVHSLVHRPVFETVALGSSQPEFVLVVQNPVRRTAKGECMQVKTPDVAGSTVLHPGLMAPQGPARDGSSTRRKRKQSSDLSAEERLQAMGEEGWGQASSSQGGAPKADTLVVQLMQGLQSKDAKMLTNAFQEKDDAIIIKTVKCLPVHVIGPLLTEVSRRLSGHPQSGLVMVQWMKHILTNHAALLTSNPEAMEIVESVYQMFDSRTADLSQAIATQGRMHMILSRREAQNQQQEEPGETGAILVYQDESSDEDVLFEQGASESEDNLDPDESKLGLDASSSDDNNDDEEFDVE